MIIVENDDLLDAYKESYITKDAAKKFLQKIKKYQASHTGAEFQNFFDGIKFKPLKNSETTFYDKKYFDYLPSDDIKGSSDNDEEIPSDVLEPPQNKHTRRWKRQTSDCKSQFLRRDI